MWKRKEKEPIGVFLTWIVIIWIFSFVTLKLLQPYSVAYSNNGELTAGYLAYAFIDLIGVSYDWNKLFDSFPGNLTANVYRIIL